MYEVYDLHTHSTASDGTLTPSELIQRAAQAGVKAIALTDHDTTGGISEASREAHRQDMVLIPGVEISVTWKSRVIHVLGLGIDPDCGALQQGLRGLRKFRDWRAEEIGRRLEKAGIAGAYMGARAYSGGGLVSRTHFARFLVEQGHARDVRKVFKRFLVSGKPGHVPGQWASLEEAVSWILDAGGQAVLAHPARYGLTRTGLRKLLDQFQTAGGEGLEVISGSHSRDDVFKMAALARDFDLLASVGSDYHGPDLSWVKLGRMPFLPAGTKPIWDGWQLGLPPADA
jgi:predicted metal-dependent phosphoesterase TrpH